MGSFPRRFRANKNGGKKRPESNLRAVLNLRGEPLTETAKPAFRNRALSQPPSCCSRTRGRFHLNVVRALMHLTCKPTGLGSRRQTQTCARRGAAVGADRGGLRAAAPANRLGEIVGDTFNRCGGLGRISVRTALVC